MDPADHARLIEQAVAEFVRKQGPEGRIDDVARIPNATPRADLAAALDADVGQASTSPHVYAEALLGPAEQAGQTDAILDEFDALVAEVLERLPGIEVDPLPRRWSSPEEKDGLLDRRSGSQASPMFLSFLKVVSRHGGLDPCGRSTARPGGCRTRSAGGCRCGLPRPRPSTRPSPTASPGSLAPLVGGEPVLEQVVDPELIGGAVVRVGDTVYDGSVANQLQNLRQQMIDRSVHEIQSRRDRFRYPAGN